jgi:uncharacterized membrane protein YkoI
MRTVIGGMAVALVVLAGAARADEEEKVPLDKLPKAVVDAVKEKFPKAELLSADKEKEDGKTLYEVAIKDGKQKIDVTVTPEGKIVAIEKEIAASDLPKAVVEALESRYPKATIQKAEEITKEDKVAVYEMVIVTADKKKLEVSFDPKGKFLEEEKKEEKKKEEKK